MTTILSLVERLLADEPSRIAYTNDPAGFLGAHGFHGLDHRDLVEAIRHSVDVLPVAVVGHLTPEAGLEGLVHTDLPGEALAQLHGSHATTHVAPPAAHDPFAHDVDASPLGHEPGHARTDAAHHHAGDHHETAAHPAADADPTHGHSAPATHAAPVHTSDDVHHDPVAAAEHDGGWSGHDPNDTHPLDVHHDGPHHDDVHHDLHEGVHRDDVHQGDAHQDAHHDGHVDPGHHV